MPLQYGIHEGSKQKAWPFSAGLLSFKRKFGNVRRTFFMKNKKKRTAKGGDRLAGSRRGRLGREVSRHGSVAALGGAGVSFTAGGFALHFSGAAAGVAVIAWGSAVLLVVLPLVAVLVLTYVFGDDERSGRVWRLLDVFARVREPAVPQPAEVRLPSGGAGERAPDRAFGGPRPVHGHVLDRSGVRRARAGHRAVSSRTRPGVPRQRSGPEGRSPKVITSGREASSRRRG